MAVSRTPAIWVLLLLLLGAVFTFGVAVSPAQASRSHRHYDFVIKKAEYTRLCQRKSILTVNGQFPGPTIYARTGDVVTVSVHNHGDKNITIHWHGVDQPRNPWFDGPEFVTQCPIQPGASFTYKVILSWEEGTLWWHAHSDFDRNTAHGAIVIRPRRGSVYPYPKPHKEVPIILGEWWNTDLQQLLLRSKRTGSDVNASDANTINGQPGDFAPCSKKDTFKMFVERGKTYLLRVINAGLSNEMFFAVAGHRLTVVGTDGSYLKPFTVDYIVISPGQTMNLLLEANCATNGSANNNRYYMAASSFVTNTALPSDKNITTAILEYTDSSPPSPGPPPESPDLPAINDTAAVTAFRAQLRSLVTKEHHPIDVPMEVDEHMFVTIAVNTLPCGANETCAGVGGERMAASMNNVSFEAPRHANILDAYYRKVRGVDTPDFPSRPPVAFNFTDVGLPPASWFTKRGTKVKVLEYGTTVEVVLQNTGLLGGDTHPIHLHGHSFYVVGTGAGNFDRRRDPAGYNLVDPPYQNTVPVPNGGWTAIRFRATNPGVWLMHCHIERHMVWGMDTVFIVKDGNVPEAKMLPPPPGMPKC